MKQKKMTSARPHPSGGPDHSGAMYVCGSRVLAAAGTAPPELETPAARGCAAAAASVAPASAAAMESR